MNKNDQFVEDQYLCVVVQYINLLIVMCALLFMAPIEYLKVHKIEIFFGFDFEICIISLLVMSKY
jgi:hypothetical protein